MTGKPISDELRVHLREDLFGKCVDALPVLTRANLDASFLCEVVFESAMGDLAADPKMCASGREKTRTKIRKYVQLSETSPELETVLKAMDDDRYHLQAVYGLLLSRFSGAKDYVGAAKSGTWVPAGQAKIIWDADAGFVGHYISG